jgi:hypothetical protein
MHPCFTSVKCYRRLTFPAPLALSFYERESASDLHHVMSYVAEHHGNCPDHMTTDTSKKKSSCFIRKVKRTALKKQRTIVGNFFMWGNNRKGRKAEKLTALSKSQFFSYYNPLSRDCCKNITRKVCSVYSCDLSSINMWYCCDKTDTIHSASKQEILTRASCVQKWKG